MAFKKDNKLSSNLNFALQSTFTSRYKISKLTNVVSTHTYAHVKISMT